MLCLPWHSPWPHALDAAAGLLERRPGSPRNPKSCWGFGCHCRSSGSSEQCLTPTGPALPPQHGLSFPYFPVFSVLVSIASVCSSLPGSSSR